jgi:hypothetical protein
MASLRDPPEPPPALRRRTVLGFPFVEAILLVLVVGAVGAGIFLLVGSKDRAVGATLLVGVLVAVGTYRTIQVTREGQITERLTKAVTQLDAKNTWGKPNEVVVLGGIYALERIAANSRADYQTIMEILTSFIRTCVPRPKGGTSEEQSKDPVAPVPNYVQAALAVLARRTPLRGELRLNLQDVKLCSAKLPHAHLQNALLIGADLRGADLRRADLRGANLQNAILCGAHLQGAKLREDKLRLTWDKLRLTWLQRAAIREKAKRKEAILEGANLEGAEEDTDTKWPLEFTKERREAEKVIQAGRGKE